MAPTITTHFPHPLTLSLRSIVERIEPILIRFGLQIRKRDSSNSSTQMGRRVSETAKTVSVNSLAEVPMVAARFGASRCIAFRKTLAKSTFGSSQSRTGGFSRPVQ